MRCCDFHKASCHQGRDCPARQACELPEWPGPEEAQSWVADLWDGARFLVLFLAILLVCRLLLVVARALT